MIYLPFKFGTPKLGVLRGAGNCKPFRSFRDMTEGDALEGISTGFGSSISEETLLRLKELFLNRQFYSYETWPATNLSISWSGSRSGDETARCFWDESSVWA